MPMDPNVIAQEWADRLAASGDKITRGVQSVTVAPGAAAARQKQAYLSGVTAKADTWARRVGAVPLASWQTSMTQKAVPRIGSGAQASKDKMAAFLTKFLPAVASAKAALPPRGTYDQNKQRMNSMVDALHKFSAS